MTLLEERGFAVDCVYDGSEAVERIRTTKPGTYDVILMDIYFFPDLCLSPAYTPGLSCRVLLP